MIRALLCACVLALASPALAQTVQLPPEIPLFPLPDVVLMPSVSRPFFVFEPRYLDMVADAVVGDRIIGMIELRPGFEANYEGRPPVYDIGCAGEIVDFRELPDGRYAIVLRGLVKFRVKSEDQNLTYRMARVEAVEEPVTEAVRASLAAVRGRLSSLINSPLVPLSEIPSPALSDEAFINASALYLNMRGPLRQNLLELSSTLMRGQKLVELLESR